MEVIRLDRVSLSRRTQEEFSYDLKKTLLSILEGKYRKPARRTVLDQIDLVVTEGERIGIIGANGSGKSTLLKVISNILQPTSGRVWVRGKVAPLIELGAGFDPEISVADNIILYGVMLGFSERDMRRRTPEILEFAGLEDYTAVPVKALSSGMVARLGFAIATDIKPDILILDEVLSVGDESFRTKCLHRIQQFWQTNATILTVSHDLTFIQESCERVIWLERGRVKLVGDAAEVVQTYVDSVKESLHLEDVVEVEEPPEEEAEAEPPEEEPPVGEMFLPPNDRSDRVTIKRLFTANEAKQVVQSINYGEPFYVAIEYIVHRPMQSLRLAFELSNDQSQILFGAATCNYVSETGFICEPGHHYFYAKIPAPLLIPGQYYITGFGVHEEGFGPHYQIYKKLLAIRINSTPESEEQWFEHDLVHPPINVTIE